MTSLNKCPACRGRGTIRSGKRPKRVECHVVADNACREGDERSGRQTTCFACGQAACTSCSVVRSYRRHGRRRICDYCEDDLEGNDRKSSARRHRHAGWQPCATRAQACVAHDSHVTDQHGRTWGA